MSPTQTQHKTRDDTKAALEYAARGADVVTSDKLAVTIGKIDAALARAGAAP